MAAVDAKRSANPPPGKLGYLADGICGTFANLADGPILVVVATGCA